MGGRNFLSLKIAYTLVSLKPNFDQFGCLFCRKGGGTGYWIFFLSYFFFFFRILWTLRFVFEKWRWYQLPKWHDLISKNNTVLPSSALENTRKVSSSFRFLLKSMHSSLILFFIDLISWNEYTNTLLIKINLSFHRHSGKSHKSQFSCDPQEVFFLGMCATKYSLPPSAYFHVWLCVVFTRDKAWCCATHWF